MEENKGFHLSLVVPAAQIMQDLTQKPPQYRPLGRPLYSKINPKLLDKINAHEYVNMSDSLVDHHPSEVDFHFSIKDKKLGLTSGKKRKFLTIENWTDAFAIYASALRRFEPKHLFWRRIWQYILI